MEDWNAKLSFENTKRVMEREHLIKKLIDSICNGFELQQKEVKKELNKALYKFAEDTGQSLYDVCFHTVPDVRVVECRHPYMNDGNTFTLSPRVETGIQITLKPLEFEFEKGPGYWKDKYLRLKEQMQAVIDAKEEPKKK